MTQSKPNYRTVLETLCRLGVESTLASCLSLNSAFQNAPQLLFSTKSRLCELIDRWTQDKYMQMFSDRNSKAQLDIITGAVRSHLTLQLISDRLAMLQQLSAMVAMMKRPLLELMMIVRGEKNPVSPEESK